jgi:hypothetical protein
MLVLAVIAIAIAGAGIYLAIDTREKAVSEGDVKALQVSLEQKINTATGSAEAAALKVEVAALKAKVEKLESSGGSGSSGEKQKSPQSAKP